MKKLSFVTLLLCITAVPSQAQNISEALKDCGRQQNSLKRLVCYDGIVQSLDRYSGQDELMHVPAPLPARGPGQALPQTSQTLPQTSQRTSNGSPVVAAPPAGGTFGLENSRVVHAEDKIYAEIVDIKKNARKRYILTLSNGHVWNQADNESLRLKVGQTIYVERGALGAFYLSKDSVNRRIRVKRSK